MVGGCRHRNVAKCVKIVVLKEMDECEVVYPIHTAERATILGSQRTSASVHGRLTPYELYALLRSVLARVKRTGRGAGRAYRGRPSRREYSAIHIGPVKDSSREGRCSYAGAGISQCVLYALEHVWLHLSPLLRTSDTLKR